MVKEALLIGIFTAIAVSDGNADTNTCISCHRELDDEPLRAPVAGMQLDVHARHGLSCVDCHGGDATAEDIDVAMSEEKGYVGVPNRRDIPGFCGRCHQNPEYMRKYNPSMRIDQLELYWTSVHGQKLRTGDPKVATCIDCHSHHGILPAADARSPVYATNVPQTCARCHADREYMAEYGIPTDQYEKYKESIHGRSLLVRGGRGAPACNDCHGNHGAAPPGVSSVANVCGQCHPVNAELLKESPHAEVFETQGIPACESCHGHHDVQRPSREMLGTGTGSVCAQCHEADTKGYVMAAAMRSALDQLLNRYDQAHDLLARAERAGMEVREPKFQLHEVYNAITKAQAVQHAASLARLQVVVSEGDSLAEITIAEGESALAELGFRRKGLQISLVFIFVLGLSLFLKIREVDRKHGLN